MKRKIALILAIVFIFALSACGESADPDTSAEPSADPAVTDAPEETQELQPVETDAPEDDPEPVEIGFGGTLATELEDPSIEELEGDDVDETGTTKAVSQEALEGELGIVLPTPEGATNLVWEKIDGDYPIAQLTFTLEGKSYCYRAQETGDAKDISEMSFGSPEIDDSNMDYTIKLEGSKGVVIWFVDGYSFSVSMSSGATHDDLELIFGIINC